MKTNYSAPWHRESWERFISQQLPELLGSRIPLRGYQVEEAGDYAVNVEVTVGSEDSEASVRYTGIPRPDTTGMFLLEGKRMVVVPLASDEDLDTAVIRCVGEQLYGFIEERLGEAPSDIAWDEAMVRTWVPLDSWISEFMQRAQILNEMNWLAKTTHLRRLIISDPQKAVSRGQFGRTCPFEIPEGPNILRVRSVSSGAEIREGRLVMVDESAEGALGVTALMVPFLEHSDSNRLLMGVNMMRQWEAPGETEPALVQTGHEPDEEGFWCGMSFMTAFVSWGADTFEDGMVISDSAAKRFRSEHPIEPGDKMSNRHGTKGVISRILPDKEMPHLPDGTAVELVFSFMGCHTRLNFGQIREAVMGRIAKAEGKPAVVPPYGSPGEEEMRSRLEKAGLPSSGMEKLRMGHGGRELGRASTVGCVYWGRTHHVAHRKIRASAGVSGPLDVQGELEYLVMREAGAFENVLETFNTRSSLRDDAETLVERVASGIVEQADAPTPKFIELSRRLRAGGVAMEFDGKKVMFRLSPPMGDVLKLAFPIPHPWLRDKEIEEVGILEDVPAGASLRSANEKASRVAGGKAPDGLKAAAAKRLSEHTAEYFADLVSPKDVCFFAGIPQLTPAGEGELRGGERRQLRALFSGRSVIAPDGELGLDQLGLPEEIAWELFGPLAQREIGEKEVKKRTKRACEVLDAVMARSWLLLNRAPTILPTGIIAFHPARTAGKAIRIHPLICLAMNADFDGDQAAVFLPVTEAGQREAGERLSVAGHLRRDPSVLRLFCPTHEMVWGLYNLSLGPEDRDKIMKLFGDGIAVPEGPMTRSAITDCVKKVMARDGVHRALETVEQLMRLGFDAAKSSGASISPFIGQGLSVPNAPETNDSSDWEAYTEEVYDTIMSLGDCRNEDHGPQLLAVKSGARGSVASMARLIGPFGVLKSAEGKAAIVRNSFSQGLTPDEMNDHTGVARTALWRLVADMAGSVRAGYASSEPPKSRGYGVIARAMRARQPGMVLARAAERGEEDLLTDIDSRLFAGLLPKV